MKKTFTSLLLIKLICLSLLASDSDVARSKWVDTYPLINQAEKLEKAQNFTKAVNQYQLILERFQKIKRQHPHYQPSMLDYRINHCRKKLRILKIRMKQEILSKPAKEIAKMYLDSVKQKAKYKKAIEILQERYALQRNDLERAREEASDTVAKNKQFEEQALRNLQLRKEIKNLQNQIKDNTLGTIAMLDIERAKKKNSLLEKEIIILRSRLDQKENASLQLRKLSVKNSQLKIANEDLVAKSETYDKQESLWRKSNNNLKTKLKASKNKADALYKKLTYNEKMLTSLQKKQQESSKSNEFQLLQQLKEKVQVLESYKEKILKAEYRYSQKQSQFDALSKAYQKQVKKQKEEYESYRDTQKIFLSQKKEILEWQKINEQKQALINELDAKIKGQRELPKATTQTSSLSIQKLKDELYKARKKNSTELKDLATKLNETLVSEQKLKLQVQQLESRRHIPVEEINTLLDNANKAFEEKRLQAAIQLFSEVLKKDEENKTALYFLGYIHYQRNEFKEARQFLQKHFYLSPDHQDTLKMLGFALIELEEYDLALSSLSRLVALEPKDPWSHIYLGMAMKAIAWSQAAEKQMQRALTLDPKQQEANYNLALLLLEKGEGHYQDAYKHYQQALASGALADPSLDTFFKDSLKENSKN